MSSPISTVTIRAAIEQVRAGDVNAYEPVYRRFDPSLRAFITARFPWAGPDFVDEVAVRTHEYALSRLAAFNPDRSAFLTWLCWQARSTASRVVGEWFSPRFVQFVAAKHETSAGTAAGPADIHEAERRSRVLREELAALAEEERLTVTLHDMAGRTFAATAQTLGIPVGRVRRLRARALARLKRRLVGRGVSPIEVDSTPPPIIHARNWTEPANRRASRV
uniref:Sigma-70 family RNA polymerase sigma factor n=1 Tax=candidate division WOR-3 bacterium TaxID=2052148 RepID=A0A7C4G9S6_UNCW3